MNDIYLQSSILVVYVAFVFVLGSVSTGCLHLVVLGSISTGCLQLYRFFIQNKVTGSMVVSSDSATLALQRGSCV
jgi:hypothetical protein